MDGSGPARRVVGTCGSALIALALVPACGHAPTPTARSVAPALEGELARVRAELTERDRLVEQLEGRLALLEASQRSLRAQLDTQQAATTPSAQTVRIGTTRPPEPEPPPEPAAPPRAEPRPLLRLHGERGRVERTPGSTRATDDRTALTATWTPPVTSERLPVVPLPKSLDAPAVVAPEAPREDRAEALYVRALDLARKRAFGEAGEALDAFLRAYPDDPRAVRVMFWRGEVLFAQRAYVRALEAFRGALAREPTGDKAPSALLRIALCHLRLGAPEEARAALAQLRTEFPDSEAARLADRVTQEGT